MILIESVSSKILFIGATELCLRWFMLNFLVYILVVNESLLLIEPIILTLFIFIKEEVECSPCFKAMSWVIDGLNKAGILSL